MPISIKFQPRFSIEAQLYQLYNCVSVNNQRCESAKDNERVRRKKTDRRNHSLHIGQFDEKKPFSVRVIFIPYITQPRSQQPHWTLVIYVSLYNIFFLSLSRLHFVVSFTTTRMLCVCVCVFRLTLALRTTARQIIFGDFVKIRNQPQKPEIDDANHLMLN